MTEIRRTPDVIVVGAGPVGLMAANLSAAAGLHTLVLEKRTERDQGSRAIGIMPPSLDIFQSLGLREQVVSAGITVTTAHVHGKRRRLGTVRFDAPGAQFPILSIPQDNTEKILMNALMSRPLATVDPGVDITDAVPRDAGVTLRSADGGTYTAPFVIACVGDKGKLRKSGDHGPLATRHEQTFLMGDFIDRSGFGSEAHLFFTPNGAVESFPLPDGLRRWIVQTDAFAKQPQGADVIDAVARRCGHRLSEDDLQWLSPFGIKERLTRPYFDGRLIYCGDAAHVMPPIGGQGMNTGFADAWMAAAIVAKSLKNTVPHRPLLDRYDTARAVAADKATRQAVLAMRIGTITGPVPSAIRNALIYLVLHTGLVRLIPRHFAMQTIPYGTVKKMAPLLADQSEL